MRAGDRFRLTVWCALGDVGTTGTLLSDPRPGKPAAVQLDSGIRGTVVPEHIAPIEKPKPRQQAAPDRDDEQAERLARADAARRRQDRERLEQFFASGAYRNL